jgi:hypothetical protein
MFTTQMVLSANPYFNAAFVLRRNKIMSTNYYLHKPSSTQCNHCGHDPESENNIIHIGKSSYGWCFALHVDPTLGINTLEDWKAKWIETGVQIKNEYGDPVTTQDMLSIITERYPGRFCQKGLEPERHKLDQYCLGNGEGSWDYMIGEFS